uniref:Vesicle associated membrane protein 1a n=1 Tax=Cyclopterus lumpus TaxID=8103 RepID=A0A8C2WKE8_CYCLU
MNNQSTPETATDGEGGPPAPNLTSNRRLQQTQAQVDEVVDIMRVNVDKVLERDQKLSELDDRADALQAGASQFESSAAKLKNKYWWKNCKVGSVCSFSHHASCHMSLEAKEVSGVSCSFKSILN